MLEEVKSSWDVVDILAIKLARRRKLIAKKGVKSFTNISSYVFIHNIENPYLKIEELSNHLKIKNGFLNETIENLVDRDLINYFRNGKLRAKSVSNNYEIK